MPSDFYARFQADSVRRLSDLRIALSCNDLEAAGGIAHSLIGSASVIGAKNMANAAQLLQACAGGNDADAARVGYEALLVEFNRVKEAMDADTYEAPDTSGRRRPTSTSQV